MAQAPAESSSRGGQPRGDRERVEHAVRELRAGERLAENCDFLFGRFSAPLSRQFVRWGCNPEEASDLIQETFQRIFQSVGSFRGGSPLFELWVGWVWKIARTTWLRDQRARRAAKRPQHRQPLEEAEGRGPMTQAGNPLDRVLREEALERVRQAVDGLPEQEFNCVVLYYYQGMKTREIAAVLRIAPGTVKAHLSHARAKLKTRLGDYFELESGPSRSEEQRV